MTIWSRGFPPQELSAGQQTGTGSRRPLRGQTPDNRLAETRSLKVILRREK